MRVLHVTESFGAGVRTAILQYRKHHWAEHDLLLSLRPEVTRQEVASLGASATVVRGKFSLIREWLRVRKEAYDVVHAHSSWAGMLVRLIPPKGNTSVVYSPHGFAFLAPERPLMGRLVRRVEAALLRRTDAVGAVGSAEAREAQRLDASAIVRTVPHAVVIPVLPHEPAMSPLRIIAVGRIGYQKNPECVADLPAYLESVGLTNVEYVWIGSGDSDRAQLLERGGWTITGWLSPSEVSEALAGATVMVHPARYEGLPLAVLEAMAHFVPVVVMDIEAFEEIDSVVKGSGQAQFYNCAESLLRDSTWRTAVSERQLDEVRADFDDAAQSEALHELYLGANARGDS